MYRLQNRIFVVFSLVTGAGLLIGGRALAADLPKGGDLMDKYVTATGGKAAYEKVKNRVVKGTLDLAANNIEGPVTIYTAAPNKTYRQIELTGVGKFEEGTDGQIVWEKNPITGVRIKKGKERAAALRSATFNDEIQWQKQYKKLECVGEEMVDGKACYKVEATTQEERPRTIFFDKNTGLIAKAIAHPITQQGEITAEVFYSDYKKVDGILIPHRIRQKAAGQEIEITLEKIEHNVKLPENRFDPPEEVKKLAEKEKGEEGKKE
jgi:hypothetical protein